MKLKKNVMIEKQSKKTIKENIEILKRINLLKKRAEQTKKQGENKMKILSPKEYKEQHQEAY